MPVIIIKDERSGRDSANLRSRCHGRNARQNGKDEKWGTKVP
jgi:hypothetical protein